MHRGQSSTTHMHHLSPYDPTAWDASGQGAQSLHHLLLLDSGTWTSRKLQTLPRLLHRRSEDNWNHSPWHFPLSNRSNPTTRRLPGAVSRWFGKFGGLGRDPRRGILALLRRFRGFGSSSHRRLPTLVAPRRLVTTGESSEPTDSRNALPLLRATRAHSFPALSLYQARCGDVSVNSESTWRTAAGVGAEATSGRALSSAHWWGHRSAICFAHTRDNWTWLVYRTFASLFDIVKLRIRSSDQTSDQYFYEHEKSKREKKDQRPFSICSVASMLPHLLAWFILLALII